MLTFFRRIRKRLLDSSHARKYFVYAAGEVLLVMVGILLALQVNNWNEWKKERVKEIKVLGDIAIDLERNSENLAELLEFNLKADKSANLIISLILAGITG